MPRPVKHEHHTPRRPGAALTRLLQRRDPRYCAYCLESEATVDLTVDHVKPWAAGGETEAENLVTCCTFCNGQKGDFPLALWALRLQLEGYGDAATIIERVYDWTHAEVEPELPMKTRTLQTAVNLDPEAFGIDPAEFGVVLSAHRKDAKYLTEEQLALLKEALAKAVASFASPKPEAPARPGPAKTKRAPAARKSSAARTSRG